MVATKYEISKFGNGGSNVVRNVHNNFGPRNTGQTVGLFENDGGQEELVFYITGDQLNRAATNDEFLVVPKIPAGATINGAYARTREVFVMGGTSPTIRIGTDTSEATNGIVITQAQAQALGTYNISATAVGTWAAPLAADTAVGTSLGGTSPTVTNAGVIEVVVRYIRL
jgi:hypothetical protein